MRALAWIGLAIILGCTPSRNGPVIACDDGVAAGGEAAGPDFVGDDALVDHATLRFADPIEHERYDRIHACLSARAQDWEHFPLRRLGNFVEEDWCRGPRTPHGCAGGGFRDDPGVDWAELSTFHHPDQWPQVFGVLVALGHRPADEGWNASLWATTNAGSIVGEGGSIEFSRVGDDAEDVDFYVGTSYEYEVAEQRFSLRAQGDAWALLDRVRASPRALRDEALSHWDRLEAEVVEALERGEVRECVYGEYEGNGIPPECIDRVPLSPARVQEELQRIRAQVRAVHEAFDAHGDALHAALLELAPVDCI